MPRGVAASTSTGYDEARGDVPGAEPATIAFGRWRAIDSAQRTPPVVVVAAGEAHAEHRLARPPSCGSRRAASRPGAMSHMTESPSSSADSGHAPATNGFVIPSHAIAPTQDDKTDDSRPRYGNEGPGEARTQRTTVTRVVGANPEAGSAGAEPLVPVGERSRSRRGPRTRAARQRPLAVGG